ncbi:LytTR family DNA-binding domain-containing protein [Larkinella soli]|uniref:LytTR family DNA-binding domain-containing protein n=1 Tax=Larkinella soli TaxID=1770527 RepID=UPI000FFCA3FC|nr:LytTR family DNA-binding domain-containing protein [Larkinella soli]
MSSSNEAQLPPVAMTDIVYLHSEDQQTWIVYFDHSALRCASISMPLEHWEKKLPDFWRINQSYLINPALIYRFHPADFPDFPLPLVELITGRTLAVSRKQTPSILRKWNSLQRAMIS